MYKMYQQSGIEREINKILIDASVILLPIFMVALIPNEIYLFI